MKQRTIAKSIDLVGIGLHKGVPVKMTLEPLPSDSGIVFYRSDLGLSIPLRIENVIDTTMATVIGIAGDSRARVSTIEHLLSAVHAYGIDNLRVVLDNEEVPIMDGSSIGFCMLLDEARVVSLDKAKRAIRIKEKIEINESEKFVRFEPISFSNSSSGFFSPMTFDFTIRFPHKAIQTQSYKFEFSTQKYKDEIARARTFGFIQEVNALRAMGLGLGGSLDNCIVLDEDRILNMGSLRYKNEFVRHKILDAIGDMALLGMPVIGGYFSFAGSHKLNHFLTKKLLSSQGAYEIIELGEETQEKSLSKTYAGA